MAWLDAAGMRPTTVAGRINGSRFGKRAGSRPVVARGCCPGKEVVNLAVLRMVVTVHAEPAPHEATDDHAQGLAAVRLSRRGQ